MRRLLIIVATTVALMLALTLPATTLSANGPRVFVDVEFLTGAAEVPPADPDATGISVILIFPDEDLVCWVNHWRNVDGQITAGHIHGPADTTTTAPPLVPFANVAKGCLVDADADAIAANPTMYYVNIHSTVYPGGAIRGQLD